MRRRGIIPSIGLALVVASGCFRGGEREKEPPPGLPGGFCLVPPGLDPSGAPRPGECDVGECYPDGDGGFCYDPEDPCEGFFCGGSDRGTCAVTNDDLPACECKSGFQIGRWSFYCCPEDDPECEG